MGVRGLQYFFENTGQNQGRSRNFFYEVDMKVLAKKSRNLSKEDSCLLVVDFSSLSRYVYHNYGRLDLICGGQQGEQLDLWRRIIRNFNEAGIKLVFVVDGATRKQISAHVKKRNCRQFNELSSFVFEELKEGRYPDLEGRRIALPVLRTAQMLQYLLGQEVVYVDGSADESVCKMARDRKAFGILTQDTDFIIYDIKCHYFSVRHLDFDTLKTFKYDRMRYASFLGLHVNHLPILALLIGNDVVTKDDLKIFYRRWKFEFYCDPRDIAKFINENNLPSTYKEIMSCLPHLTRKVFPGKPEMKAVVRDVVNAYFMKSLQIEGEQSGEDSIVERLPFQLRSVYTDREFVMPFVLEDSSGKLPSSAKLQTDVRQRMYQVILQDQQLPTTVTELLFQVSNPLVRAEVSERPPEWVPSLEDLYEGFEEMYAVRWRLMIFILFGNEDEGIARAMREAVRVEEMILLFPILLLKCTCFALEDWELKAVVVQYHLLQKLTIDDLNELNPLPTARGVHLASLLTNVRLPMVTRLCGEGFVDPRHFLLVDKFDGKLFQAVYNEMARGEEELMKRFDLDARLSDEMFEQVVRFSELILA